MLRSPLAAAASLAALSREVARASASRRLQKDNKGGVKPKIKMKKISNTIGYRKIF
jgi:hypothetical protein